MLRSIGALMVSTNSGLVSDPDARAFIDAAGITDTTQKNAINALVIAAKANGWWTLCNAIYPMVGGTATTHKYNLKDPQDTDAAFRLNFQGTWTHSSTGALPDGSTAYADSFLIPSVTLTANSSHISYYSRTNASTGSAEIGCDDVFGTIRFTMACKTGATFQAFTYATNAEQLLVSNSDSLGHFITTRTGANAVEAFTNGASIDSDTFAVVSIPTTKIFIGAINKSGSAAEFSNKQCAFATIGAGISSALASTMYTDINTYQTSLSRNV